MKEKTKEEIICTRQSKIVGFNVKIPVLFNGSNTPEKISCDNYLPKRNNRCSIDYKDCLVYEFYK